jgi:methylase of polypeptide subunit release factors
MAGIGPIGANHHFSSLRARRTFTHQSRGRRCRYLTESTLSRQLPRECSDTIRILDPSCGSGIFLIAAMLFLAEHARATNGENRNPIQDTLDSIASCVFGIDINSTAIEWARRSLLLAVWEMDPDGDHSRLRVPDLRRNLVAANFLAAESPAGFPVDFDAILGGPPFVRFRQMKKDCPIQINDWRKRFVTARKGQFDLYMPFFEQAIRRLKTGGRLGWSVSNTFLRSQFGASLRELVGNCCTVNELVEFENPKLYADAVTQIVLVQLSREKSDESCRHVWVRGNPELRQALEAIYAQPDAAHTNLEMRQLPENACCGRNWRLNTCRSSLVDGGGEKRSTLKELGVQITHGIVTGADAVFLLRLVREAESELSWVEDREGRRHRIETSLLKPAIRSRGIRGYSQPRIQNHLLLPYDARGRLLSKGDLKADFPATYSYLWTRRNEIPRTGKRNRPFYAFRNDAVLRLESGPRIIIGMVTSGSDATLDLVGNACPHAGVLVISRFRSEVDPLYLLGVMNSPVFWSFVQGTMPTMGNGRHAIRRRPLAQFSVALPERSTQLEIAGSVRQLMETADKHERTCIKQTIDTEAMKIYGVDSTAGIDSNMPARKFKSRQ